MTIAVYGASDDIVVIEGDVADEVAPGKLITVGDENRGLRVRFTYAPSKKSGAVWRGSIEQIDEGVPMFDIAVAPAAPNGFPNPQSYSVMFTIQCPPGTPVKVGNRHINRKAST